MATAVRAQVICLEGDAPVRIEPAPALATTTPESATASGIYSCNRLASRRLSEPGFGPLTAAKLVGEIAAALAFPATPRSPAPPDSRHPVSSGKTNRHRLDRGGNRQLNAAIHRVAVTRARCDLETQIYIARKTAEGKTNREATR